MLRNPFQYVSYSDLKKFPSDFKAVYNAPNEAAALSELEAVKVAWGKKYPYAISNWENSWGDVGPFFQFSEEIYHGNLNSHRHRNIYTLTWND